MSVPAARTDPCLKRYPLRRLRLPVANGTLDVVVPDAGAWLHTGGWSERAARGEEPPYWADVWPAAVAVARLLCRRGSLFGQRCLDLGCGIGVPGIAAARLGAAVTFADREPDALAFAAWNARRQPAAEALVTTRVHDWHAGSLAGAFDLLLLADVTYRVVHHRPVLQQMAASLLGGGIAIHADPYRREVAGFLVQAKASFACCELALSTHWDGQRIPIRVCVFAEQQVTLDRWAATAKLNMPRKLADDQGECPATLRPLA
ncbi:MAG: methyltransferase domain-containing protein [Planctomycetota bacterium]|nr:methyltransferase domain-containing protein [Planctomycetota bacterium]